MKKSYSRQVWEHNQSHPSTAEVPDPVIGQRTWWQKVECFFGFHDWMYKNSYTPYEDDDGEKVQTDFVKICKKCGHRRVIVGRSLLLGD